MRHWILMSTGDDESFYKDKLVVIEAFTIEGPSPYCYYASIESVKNLIDIIKYFNKIKAIKAIPKLKNLIRNLKKYKDVGKIETEALINGKKRKLRSPKSIYDIFSDKKIMKLWNIPSKRQPFDLSRKVYFDFLTNEYKQLLANPNEECYSIKYVLDLAKRTINDIEK